MTTAYIFLIIGLAVVLMVWYDQAKHPRSHEDVQSELNAKFSGCDPIEEPEHEGEEFSIAGPIKATRSGKVTTAQYSSSAGYYVKIDHGDGFASIYMHMTHYIVKKGQQVEAGQVIGYMGSTGTSTGSHLHFGITYKGTYVNPKKYIKI